MATRGCVYAVILAGGSGQRFWPLSRELSPKQMLTVFGHNSLIVQAIHRVDDFVEPGDVLVVTGERLFDELRNHLSSQSESSARKVRYLVEPLARNTAPAIAYAAATLELTDPEAVMIVSPSDHLLDAGQEWKSCVRSAIDAARSGFLVTIGITPTGPETGYGYIKVGHLLPDTAHGTEIDPALSASPRGEALAHVAERFVEKPELSVAKALLAEGGYLWNSGIFVMRAAQVLEEMDSFEDTAPIAQTARWLARQSASGSPDLDEARERFSKLSAISIDHAVLERSESVAVIPASLKWSDVGSLLALEGVATPDEGGVVRSGRGVDIDTSSTIVYSTDRLVATLGVKDLLVIDTADATLVAAKDRAQDVRLVVDALLALKAEEAVLPKVSLRPWGSWTSLLKGPGFQIKLLEIHAGAKPSLQRHHHRSEHWIVVAGTALVTRGDERFEVHVNESAYIPIGSTHRIENCGKVPLKVIEVQVGEYLGEDDIVRIEDDWNREV